jgi:transcriptional regulator with XRE-family HTH domain
VMIEAASERWEAVAEAIKDRRDELGMTQAEGVIRAGGHVGSSTWSLLERGQKTSYERGKLRAVSRALGWSFDSIERMIGGQPPIDATESSREQELTARLYRVEETLRELLRRFQLLEERRQQQREDPQSGQATD